MHTMSALTSLPAPCAPTGTDPSNNTNNTNNTNDPPPALHLLNALYAEDIIDALEYAQLEHIPLCNSDACTIPMAPWGAYVGHGYGLCDDYTNQTKCNEQMSKYPPRHPCGFLLGNKTVIVTWTKDFLQISHRNLEASLYS